MLPQRKENSINITLECPPYKTLLIVNSILNVIGSSVFVAYVFSLLNTSSFECVVIVMCLCSVS